MKARWTVVIRARHELLHSSGYQRLRERFPLGFSMVRVCRNTVRNCGLRVQDDFVHSSKGYLFTRYSSAPTRNQSDKSIRRQIMNKHKAYLKHKQRLDDWMKYEKVRASGKFNMFDPRARQATGLSRERYSYVLWQYETLKNEVCKL